MNPLLLILGLLGVAAAVSGGSSSSTTTTAGTTTPPTTDGMTSDETDTPPVDDVPTEDDGGADDMPMDDAPTDGMDDMAMDDGGTDHGDHGGMDHGDHDGMHNMPTETGPFVDITTFGMHHGTSSHTHHDSLLGGRTAITTEALESYNDLRQFLNLEPITDLEEIGEWAFANDLTNNDVPYGGDLMGVGLYYAMQGAKAGWIADENFDPQLLADIQREARLGEPDNVMSMVESNGIDGFAAYLEENGLVDTFLNTLRMEPHYGGWMHGRTHGDLQFADETGANVATAHDLNHLTVLSHDQTQPFMNDTFDWPQWPALDAPEATVANYFQSMVTLGDPQGEGIVNGMAAEEMAWIAGAFEGETLMALLATDTASDESLPVSDDTETDEDLVLF